MKHEMSINIYNFDRKNFRMLTELSYLIGMCFGLSNLSQLCISVINFNGIIIVQSSTKNKFLSTLNSSKTYLGKMRRIWLNKILLSHRVKEKNKLSCLGRFGMLGKFWLGNTRQQQLNRILAWPLTVGNF